MVHSHYTATVNVSSNSKAVWLRKLGTTWADVTAQQEALYSINKRKTRVRSSFDSVLGFYLYMWAIASVIKVFGVVAMLP